MMFPSKEIVERVRIEYPAGTIVELLEMDFPARIEMGDGYYRVRVGNFGTLNEATAMEQRLKRAGYPTVIVT